MKAKQIIKANGAEFCSEMDYFRKHPLPTGIINKKLTGCGLTTVALENPYPTIVAVPTQELIRNKVEQYPNKRFKQHLMGFYADNNNLDALTHYIVAWKYPKIIVTYNSFDKVADLVQTQFPAMQFRIVVDEFSELLDAYGYRNHAIDSMRESLKGFEYVSYISATPTKQEYLPVELTQLPVYEIDWGEKMEKVHVESIETDEPYKLMVNYINHYKNEGGYSLEIEGEKYHSTAAYVFLNSVDDIYNILKNAKLKPEVVRIICAKNEKNVRKLGPYLASMGKALDTKYNEKPFNFITSAAFKGVDFFSHSGITFVVSNVNKSYTLTSIDTDLIQIPGRIRTKENPFRNKIFHIYNTGTRVSEQAVYEIIDKKEERSYDFIYLYNQLDSKGKEQLRKEMREHPIEKDRYLHYNPEQDEYELNTLAKNNDLRKADIILYTYKNGSCLINQYKKNNFTGNKFSKTLKTPVRNYSRKEFPNKDLFEWYAAKYAINKLTKDQILEYLPQIDDYLNALGIERIRELKYNLAAIRREINTEFGRTMDEVRIESDARKVFKVDQPYQALEVKQKLASIYGKYGLHRKAKGTHLVDIFGAQNVEHKSFRELGNNKAFVIKHM